MRCPQTMLPATLMVCFGAVLAIVLIKMLDKEGRLTARLDAHVIVLAAPLLTIAGAALTFRHHSLGFRHPRWLPCAGLAVAATAAVLIVGGCAMDYLSWSRKPPGQDVMHFAAFTGMLLSWLACLGYLAIGGLILLRARRQPAAANPRPPAGHAANPPTHNSNLATGNQP